MSMKFNVNNHVCGMLVKYKQKCVYVIVNVLTFVKCTKNMVLLCFFRASEAIELTHARNRFEILMGQITLHVLKKLNTKLYKDYQK